MPFWGPLQVSNHVFHYLFLVARCSTLGTFWWFISQEYSMNFRLSHGKWAQGRMKEDGTSRSNSLSASGSFCRNMAQQISQKRRNTQHEGRYKEFHCSYSHPSDAYTIPSRVRAMETMALKPWSILEELWVATITMTHTRGVIYSSKWMNKEAQLQGVVSKLRPN